MDYTTGGCKGYFMGASRIVGWIDHLLTLLFLFGMAWLVLALHRRSYERGRAAAEEELAHRDGYFRRQAILEGNIRGLQRTVNVMATAMQALDRRMTDTVGSEEEPWDVAEELGRVRVVPDDEQVPDSFYKRHGFS